MATPTPAPAPAPVSLPATGFVRLADILKYLPVSDSTVWRKVKNGTFPAPVKLSDRITAWRAEDVRAWLHDKGVAA